MNTGSFKHPKPIKKSKLMNSFARHNINAGSQIHIIDLKGERFVGNLGEEKEFENQVKLGFVKCYGPEGKVEGLNESLDWLDEYPSRTFPIENIKNLYIMKGPDRIAANIRSFRGRSMIPEGMTIKKISEHKDLSYFYPTNPKQKLNYGPIYRRNIVYYNYETGQYQYGHNYFNKQYNNNNQRHSEVSYKNQNHDANSSNYNNNKKSNLNYDNLKSKYNNFHYSQNYFPNWNNTAYILYNCKSYHQNKNQEWQSTDHFYKNQNYNSDNNHKQSNRGYGRNSYDYRGNNYNVKYKNDYDDEYANDYGNNNKKYIRYACMLANDKYNQYISRYNYKNMDKDIRRYCNSSSNEYYKNETFSKRESICINKDCVKRKNNYTTEDHDKGRNNEYTQNEPKQSGLDQYKSEDSCILSNIINCKRCRTVLSTIIEDSDESGLSYDDES